MLMQMLQAGGMTLLVDDRRTPDESNPRGYCEYAPVKSLEKDKSWVSEAEGKAVKVISQLLYHLPEDRTYKVLFMQRKMQEVLDSQSRMLERLGMPRGPETDAMRIHFERHLASLADWLAARPQFQILHCPYKELVNNPRPLAQCIVEFLGQQLDLDAMVHAVEPTLYRQRTAGP